MGWTTGFRLITPMGFLSIQVGKGDVSVVLRGHGIQVIEGRLSSGSWNYISLWPCYRHVILKLPV